MCLQPKKPIPGFEIVWSVGIGKALSDEANTFVSLIDYKYVIFFIFRDSTASELKSRASARENRLTRV